MIPVGIAIIGVSLSLLTLWQIRRRRQNRLALRVLAGRRRLLGEEVDQRLQELAQFDDDELVQQTLAATGIVDHVHVGLLEQQARLQNLEDLAHLQRHKIAVLAHHLAEAPAFLAPEEEPADETAQETPASRETLEDDLLGRIGQHAAHKTPKPRPRK